MKGYRLSILRHGHTSANNDGRYIGSTDLPLSDEGREELVNKFNVSDYPKVQKVYSSPLLRCTQSAEILFPDREMMTIPELAEMDFGDFEGKNVDELIELPEYKAWLKGGLDNSPPNGESLRKITERTYQALQNILINMSNENLSHCGIVTHSGIIMNMLACFGLPKMKPLEFASEVGEGYEIVISLQLWQSGGVFEIIGKLPYTADFDDGYDF